MINFFVFIMFQFNIFIKEKEFQEFIFDMHVKYELRFPEEKYKNGYNIKSLINEYQEVNKNNYPHLSCAYHFGYINRSCTRPILMFNQEYQSFCRHKIEHGGFKALRFFGEALEESKKIHSIYDMLDDAFTEELTLFRRRKALHLMREYLGEEHFYKGMLPPPVPIWKFELFD